MKVFFLRPASILLLVLLLFLTAPVPYSRCQEPSPVRKLFFYYPDCPQNNLSSLKSQMDGFFVQAGLAIQVQPFAHLADFDAGLRQQRPAFQWLPHWYAAKFGAQLGLRPFLVAAHSGETTYCKVLITARKNPQHLTEMPGRSLAMTAMGPEREKLLTELLFAPNNLQGQGLTIIEVPKDSDGLLALLLGQVDFALVSEDNLRILSRMNAMVERQAVPLHKTLPIPMPLLCYQEGTVGPEELSRVRELFLKPETAPNGKQLLEMLQVDAWQTVSH